MKKYLLIMITLIATLTLSGCVKVDYNSATVNEYEYNEESNQETNEETTKDDNQQVDENIIEKIKIQVKPGTLTNSEVTLMVTNNTNDEFYYGLEFTLEKNVSGTWQEVPMIDSIDYITSVNTVASKTTIEDKINWLGEYGNLGSGTYRLTKKYMGKEVINAYVVFSI